MKSSNVTRILSLFVVVFIFSSCTQKPKQLEWIHGYPEDFSQHDKIVMVDFYGKGCSPCVRMDNETFSDSLVSQFLADNFICYKLDNTIKENKPIVQKNRVYGIPSFIFYNSKGEEIERLMYFMEAETFLTEIKRIYKGDETYLSLRKKVEKDPNNIELLLKLAEKELRIGRKGDENSQELWKGLISITESGSFESDYAKYNYFTGVLWKYEQPDSLIAFLDQLDDYSFKLDGFKTIIAFYNYKEDSESESKYYKSYSDYLFERKEKYEEENFSTFLDKYSWRMTEFEQNLDDALVKIDYVISNSNLDKTKKATLLDTKSEVLWKLNRKSEALEIVEQCISMLPENEYLKEKKSKIEQEI